MTDFGRNPVWLNDNRRLIFADLGKMYLLDSQTGRSQELYSVEPGGFGIFSRATTAACITVLFQPKQTSGCFPSCSGALVLEAYLIDAYFADYSLFNVSPKTLRYPIQGQIFSCLSTLPHNRIDSVIGGLSAVVSCRRL